MSRGEEQKPVTDGYRDGWDRIFGSKPEPKCNWLETCSDWEHDISCEACANCQNGGQRDVAHTEDAWNVCQNEKAPPVKTEPCPECYPGKPGKRLIDADGFACFERCSYCGGEGVIPLET